MDEVERGQQEIVLVRNRRRIARLVPEPPARNALDLLGNVFRTLDDETADAQSEAIRASRKGKGGTLSDLRDPWAS